MTATSENRADPERQRIDSEPDHSYPVSSHNEWDPLEEVIVGVLHGAAIPAWHPCLETTMPAASWPLFRQRGGRPFPPREVEAGNRQLDELARILEAEGVTVRRPEVLDHSRPYATPDWQSAGGFYAAMPRDLLLVVGDEIIEAPLAWRSRHFEIHAYRELLKSYFQQGARWTAAPPPRLDDAQYNPDCDPEAGEYVITEYEPTFDAADFVRCGRDIFVQKSQVTNDFGIEWLERHLGDDYTIHRLSVNDPHAMHLDATFVPLAPGKVLLQTERLPELPPMFRGWDVLEAPEPALPKSWPLYISSRWISINVLMLDEERVVVERQEEPLIAALTDWGFECIKVDFRHVMPFGGAFHCVTCDVRRRGGLESYF